MTELVLADNHEVFLDALAEVLSQRGFTIGATATDVTGLIGALRRVRPQVCLVDRHFGNVDGLDAIGSMRTASPDTKIMIISADRDPDGVLLALRAGAVGYLHKSRGISALITAIERVLGGETVAELPERDRQPTTDAHRLAAHLTSREWECLAMLVDGLDTRAIATKLGVSRTTVRTHVQALLAKLGVHSRLEAASFAVRYRLLDDTRDSSSRDARAM